MLIFKVRSVDRDVRPLSVTRQGPLSTDIRHDCLIFSFHLMHAILCNSQQTEPISLFMF